LVPIGEKIVVSIDYFTMVGVLTAPGLDNIQMPISRTILAGWLGRLVTIEPDRAENRERVIRLLQPLTGTLVLQSLMVGRA
jgi:hypothetical protein